MCMCLLQSKGVGVRECVCVSECDRLGGRGEALTGLSALLMSAAHPRFYCCSTVQKRGHTHTRMRTHFYRK